MTEYEFVRSAQADGIRSDAYDLDGSGDRNECYVLTQVDGAWLVFYGERGLQNNLRRFVTQGAALGHLLATLQDDPTTRS